MIEALECGPADLNDPRVRSLTRTIASEFKLEPEFIEFLFAEARPECFEYWCESPATAWTCYLPDEVEVAYPLWSTNADQTLLLVSGEEVTYAKGWHDRQDIEIISRSVQGLLARLMNEIGESEATDSEMKEAAGFCGFRYLRDYQEFCTSGRVNSRNWSSVWPEFLAEIDEKALRST